MGRDDQPGREDDRRTAVSSDVTKGEQSHREPSFTVRGGDLVSSNSKTVSLRHRLRRLIVLAFVISTLPAHAGDEDIAQLYYARLARHREAEKTLGLHSPIASGIVRNSLDEPIAGATVSVIRVRTVDGQTKFDELAKGVTDDSVAFRSRRRRARKTTSVSRFTRAAS